MELQYLQELLENKRIGYKEIEGVSEEAILAAENKLGFKFPQVYREYLFLAGAYGGSISSGTSSLEELASDWHQEILEEVMADYGTVIDRPFWVFSENNGCEQFKFFFLDEGDDPYTNSVDYHDTDPSKQKITRRHIRFSQMIQMSIRGAKHRLELGLPL